MLTQPQQFNLQLTLPRAWLSSTGFYHFFRMLIIWWPWRWLWWLSLLWWLYLTSKHIIICLPFLLNIFIWNISIWTGSSPGCTSFWFWWIFFWSYHPFQFGPAAAPIVPQQQAHHDRLRLRWWTSREVVSSSSSSLWSWLSWKASLSENSRVNMADAKFSFQEKGKMYHPAWIAPEVCHHHHYIFIIIVLFWESSSLSPCLIVPEVCHMYHGHRHGHLHHYCHLIFEISLKCFYLFRRCQKAQQTST